MSNIREAREYKKYSPLRRVSMYTILENSKTFLLEMFYYILLYLLISYILFKIFIPLVAMLSKSYPKKIHYKYNITRRKCIFVFIQHLCAYVCVREIYVFYVHWVSYLYFEKSMVMQKISEMHVCIFALGVYVCVRVYIHMYR